MNNVNQLVEGGCHTDGSLKVRVSYINIETAGIQSGGWIVNDAKEFFLESLKTGYYYAAAIKHLNIRDLREIAGYDKRSTNISRKDAICKINQKYTGTKFMGQNVYLISDLEPYIECNECGKSDCPNCGR